MGPVLSENGGKWFVILEHQIYGSYEEKLLVKSGQCVQKDKRKKQ